MTFLHAFSQNKPAVKREPDAKLSYDLGWYRIDMNNTPFSAVFYDDFSFHEPNGNGKIPYSPYTPFLQEKSDKYWLLRSYESGRPYESKIENERMKIRFYELGEGWVPLLYNPMKLATNAFDIRLIIDKSDNSVFSGLFIGSRNMNDGIHITLTNWGNKEVDGLGYDFYDDGIVKKNENIKDVRIYKGFDNELRIKKENEKIIIYVNGFAAYEVDNSDLRDYTTIGLLASGRKEQSTAVFKSIFINIMNDVSKFINKTEANIVKVNRTAGVYSVPVTLNGVLKIDFIFDSGASDVSISPDVALTLLKTGTIKKEDWLEGAYYKFADGSVAKSKRFKLKSLQIGNKIINNVTCSISNSLDAPMLLGQGVLSKFGKYTFNNLNQTLTIE